MIVPCLNKMVHKPLSFCGVFFLLFGLYPRIAHAEFDLSLGSMARSYPAGALGVATAGYSKKIYDEGAWKYGYARAAVNAGTIGVVNRVGGELQFAPISILLLGVGQDFTFRAFRPGFVDCTSFQCVGPTQRRFIRGHFVIAIKRVSFLLQWRYERVRSLGGVTEFFDEMTVVRGRSSGETMLSFLSAALVRTTQELSLGVAGLTTRAIQSRNSSLMLGPAGTYRFTSGASLLVGFGVSRSPFIDPGFSAFSQIQFPLYPGPSILERPR
jgi:hypothetical protein